MMRQIMRRMTTLTMVWGAIFAAGLGLCIGSLSLSAPAVAGSLPSNYNTAIYVPSTWTTSQANAAGQGVSTGGTITLFLDFGGQAYNSTWGAVAFFPNTFEPNSWITGIANAFMQGYSSTHTSTAEVFVGTSNFNTNWGQGSAYWGTGGKVWGTLVSGLTAQTHAIPEGGSDLESWYCPSGSTNCSNYSWVAYGGDAVTWVQDFQTTCTDLMGDYGTNGYAEDSSAWSQADTYNVSYGLIQAVGFPEIYVSANATQWQATDNAYPMSFWGITAGGSGYLSWQTAWNDLASAVGSASLGDSANQF